MTSGTSITLTNATPRRLRFFAYAPVPWKVRLERQRHLLLSPVSPRTIKPSGPQTCLREAHASALSKTPSTTARTSDKSGSCVAGTSLPPSSLLTSLLASSSSLVARRQPNSLAPPRTAGEGYWKLGTSPPPRSAPPQGTEEGGPGGPRRRPEVHGPGRCSPGPRCRCSRVGGACSGGRPPTAKLFCH